MYKSLPNPIILFVFIVQISLIQAQQNNYSIHQEQNDYYKQLGPLSLQDYDRIHEYKLQANRPQKRNCSLNKIVFGWHPYWMGSAYNNYDWNLLSDFSFFSYEVDAATGNALSTHGWSTAPSVDAALQNGVRVNLCVTLFSGHNTFFASSIAQQTLITNLINLVQSRGAHGVNIDFEGIPSAQKSNFTNFMVSLANQMHTAIPGSQVSTVLYAVDWNNVFDIPVLSQHVDLFVVMGYGYYYSGSSKAGPNDPLYPFESAAYPYSLSRTIGYYLQKGMPKNKLVMGLPYYGREWTTTSGTVPATTTGSIGAKTYSQIRNNSSGNYNNEQWHMESKTPYFAFLQGTDWHQCFALNANSMAARLDNIIDYDIGGMGIWALGYDNGYNDLWNVIENKLTNCYSRPCTDTLYDMGGAFRKYYNSQDYTLTIDPSNGAYPLDINFLNFSIENNYDYLYLYDGTDTSNLIGIYTGTNSPGSLVVNSGALTMRFYADAATVNDGWALRYACQTPSNLLSDTIKIGENNLSTVNCSSAYQFVFDSGGKLGNYSNNEQLSQTLCNSDSNRSIQLSFRPNPTADSKIKLKSTAQGNDYLFVYNGPNNNSNLMGSFTGTTSAAPQPGSFVSSGHCLTVAMETDSLQVAAGFEAWVSCVDRPVQSTVQIGGQIGSVTFTDDAGSNTNYSNNQRNITTFCPHSSVDSSEVVWAYFTDTLGLENNWDYLYVFDGHTTQEPLINVYTGDSNNINLIESIGASTDNQSGCLTFQFFSDGSNNFDGWEATMTTAAARLSRGAESCANATVIQYENKAYAGSTATATGRPGTEDPALNLSIASLPECSGNNTITRIENSIWYSFQTIDTFCFANQIAIKLNNISCQSVTGSGSGIQFVLYELSTCQQGINWGNPIYCADKLLTGDSVIINSLLKENTTYYLMIDGFSGQNCNFDITLENSDTSGCTLLNSQPYAIEPNIQVYPNPTFGDIFVQYEQSYNEFFNYKLYDIRGKLLMQEQNVSNAQVLSIGDIKKGIYILELEIGSKFYYHKLQKI